MAPPSDPAPGGSRPRPPADGRVELPSAAPSTSARVLAVVAIAVAGACGGLIGYGIVDLSGGPSGAGAGAAVGGLVGAVLAAAGVAVVAVLVLRAMTEWRTIEDRARSEGRPPPGPGRRRP
ncbi:MAG TPA: hypothetical protein VEW93_08440 [Acidimicrobiales bacterium]|nr:hypothetical protein [Acidimicrobiales bacterium]